MTIAKKIWKIDALNCDLNKVMLTKLRSETKNVCKMTNNSILRHIKSENLVKFKFQHFNNQLKIDAPLVVDSISAITGMDTNSPIVAIAAAILLKGKSQKMSAVHHIVGQLLDNGGATDEVCIHVMYFKTLYCLYL